MAKKKTASSLPSMKPSPKRAKQQSRSAPSMSGGRTQQALKCFMTQLGMDAYILIDRSVHHKKNKSGYDGLFYRQERDESSEELWKSIGGFGTHPQLALNVVMPWRGHINEGSDWQWLQRVTVFHGKPDVKAFAEKRAKMLSEFINSQPKISYKVQFYVSWENEGGHTALNEYLEDEDVAMLLKFIFFELSKDALGECDELMEQAYGDAELGKTKLESMDDDKWEKLWA